MDRRKIESRAENGLLELVWEDGQVVMKDQASTMKGCSSSKPHLASEGSEIIIDKAINHHSRSSNTDLLNFPHFSRPALLAKSNVSSSLCDGKIGSSEKFAISCSKSKEPLETGRFLVNPKKAEAKDLRSMHRREDSCVGKTIEESAANSRKEVPRMNDVITSSMGIGNTAEDRLSYDRTKRKKLFPNADESDSVQHQSDDDFETESLGAKKPTDNGSKRRRRAADNASTLDEAIEYLKTLQLQVQIMSMRASLCMPPPPIYPHPISLPQFTPLFIAGEPRIQSPFSNIEGYGNPMQGIPGLVLPMGTHHASRTIPKADAVMNENQHSMFDSEVSSSANDEPSAKQPRTA